jgi:hypothetical protein
VIVGLGIVVAGFALAVPVCRKARDIQDAGRTHMNLLRMSLAVHDFASVHERALPPSVGTVAGRDGTFFFHILPHIEQDAVWHRGDTGAFVGDFYSSVDPSNELGKPWTSFASNAAVFGVSPEEPALLGRTWEGRDAHSVIILLSRFAVAGGNVHAWADTASGATYLDGPTSSVQFMVFSSGNASNQAAQAFGSGKYCQVGLADGSARSITREMSLETFRWACDPKGPIHPPSDW